jgi:hypothetical protein
MVLVGRTYYDAEAPIADGMAVVRCHHECTLDEALNYAQGLESVYAITTFMGDLSLVNWSLLPLIGQMLRMNPPWTEDTLLQTCSKEIEEFYGGPDYFRLVFNSGIRLPPDWLDRNSALLSRYMIDARFQRACSYLSKSLNDLGGVCITDWRDAGWSRDFDVFLSASQKESSFQNAFKAVEALVGEPSKNRGRAKIVSRLSELGIDPEKPFGIDSKPVVDLVLTSHDTRDRIAAHGTGKYKRGLRAAEVLELQALARYLLLAGALMSPSTGAETRR